MLSARMAAIYQSDMKDLGCCEPSHEPKVSENIPAIIEMIEQIVAQGHGYEIRMPSGTRDVYFGVRSFPGYAHCDRFEGTLPHGWNMGEQYRPQPAGVLA